MATGVACSSINNPIHPAAEVRIVDVKPVPGTIAGAQIGIRQSTTTVDGNNAILYTYTEPIVTVENKPLLPRVNFYKFQIEYRLGDGTNLPAKEFPLNKTMSATGLSLDIQFSVLSVDNDLRGVVYPGNRAPRVGDGMAYLKLFGKDDNGYEVVLNTTFPLSFESVVFSESTEIPLPIPSVSPSPGASPSPQP
jgi:hypothetical protein